MKRKRWGVWVNMYPDTEKSGYLRVGAAGLTDDGREAAHYPTIALARQVADRISRTTSVQVYPVEVLW